LRDEGAEWVHGGVTPHIQELRGAGYCQVTKKRSRGAADIREDTAE
jgi:hypothetical protein